MLQHSHLASINEQTIAQAELDAYIEAQAQVAAPEIEIDSDIDRSWGTLYRVWHSYHLLGTFYQAVDGLWEVQSSYTDEKPRCSTAAEAQLLIVAMSGLLVADIAIESADIDQLLDKPFDELISEEWERSLATCNSSAKLAPSEVSVRQTSRN